MKPRAPYFLFTGRHKEALGGVLDCAGAFRSVADARDAKPSTDTWAHVACVMGGELRIVEAYAYWNDRRQTSWRAVA